MVRLLGSVARSPTGRCGRSAMARVTHLPSRPMEPKLLWRPSAERAERAAITAFARAVGREGDYDELWRWSVEDLEGFWAEIWEYFDVQASEPYERVLVRREMPGAGGFPGAWAGAHAAPRGVPGVALFRRGPLLRQPPGRGGRDPPCQRAARAVGVDVG